MKQYTINNGERNEQVSCIGTKSLHQVVNHLPGTAPIKTQRQLCLHIKHTLLHFITGPLYYILTEHAAGKAIQTVWALLIGDGSELLSISLLMTMGVKPVDSRSP